MFGSPFAKLIWRGRPNRKFSNAHPGSPSRGVPSKKVKTPLGNVPAVAALVLEPLKMMVPRKFGRKKLPDLLLANISAESYRVVAICSRHCVLILVHVNLARLRQIIRRTESLLEIKELIAGSGKADARAGKAARIAKAHVQTREVKARLIDHRIRNLARIGEADVVSSRRHAENRAAEDISRSKSGNRHRRRCNER